MKMVKCIVLLSFLMSWLSLVMAHDYTSTYTTSSCPRCYLVGPKKTQVKIWHDIYAHDVDGSHDRIHHHVHGTYAGACGSC
jgi:hypothetical protein